RRALARGSPLPRRPEEARPRPRLVRARDLEAGSRSTAIVGHASRHLSIGGGLGKVHREGTVTLRQKLLAPLVPVAVVHGLALQRAVLPAILDDKHLFALEG